MKNSGILRQGNFIGKVLENDDTICLGNIKLYTNSKYSTISCSNQEEEMSMDKTTVMRCLRVILKKQLELNPKAELKVKMDDKKVQTTYAELLKEVEKLTIVENCSNCSCGKFEGKEEMGWCYPKNYTSRTLKTNYCRFYQKGEYSNGKEK